jgi:hypothetical protein
MSDARSSLNIPASIIMIGLVVSTLIGARTFYAVKSLSNTISVTGSAEQIITSDTVKWSASISRTVGAGELSRGSVLLKNDLAAARIFLKNNDIADEEVTVDPSVITPLCDSSYGVFYDKFGNQACAADRTTGYQFRQRLVVESNNVEAVTAVAQEAINELISKGIVFESNGLEYFYSKLADVRIELLSKATQNAEERANAIAKSTETKIGNLQSAAVGVFQITPVNSIEISDYGSYDTTSIEKKVTAVVRAAFTVR